MNVTILVIGFIMGTTICANFISWMIKAKPAVQGWLLVSLGFETIAFMFLFEPDLGILGLVGGVFVVICSMILGGLLIFNVIDRIEPY